MRETVHRVYCVIEIRAGLAGILKYATVSVSYIEGKFNFTTIRLAFSIPPGPVEFALRAFKWRRSRTLLTELIAF